MASVQWNRFYKRFMVTDQKDNKSYYDTERIIIGFSLLTNDSPAEKAGMIFEVLEKRSGRSYLK